MFAVHAQAKARQRDADLGRRDVAVAAADVVENGDDAPGAAVALRCEVLEAGARCADDRELRSDERARSPRTNSRMRPSGEEDSRSSPSPRPLALRLTRRAPAP